MVLRACRGEDFEDRGTEKGENRAGQRYGQGLTRNDEIGGDGFTDSVRTEGEHRQTGT